MLLSQASTVLCQRQTMKVLVLHPASVPALLSLGPAPEIPAPSYIHRWSPPKKPCCTCCLPLWPH